VALKGSRFALMRGGHFRRVVAAWLAIGAALTLASLAPASAADSVVEIPSRGLAVRALLVQPANPIGSVILLAGGHGNINLSPTGKIGWGADNEVVRTRAAYAAAGYVTLVPDIAPDLKAADGSGVAGYRIGDKNAADIGAEVGYLRGLKSPVILIGTSRGSLSAANAVARLTGAARPDALVISSPLVGTDARDFTVEKTAGNDPARLNLPFLLIEHRADICPATLPSGVEPFRQWVEQNGRRLDILWMEGGDAPRGDPCDARAPHGFPGIDGKVVAATVAWIKAQGLGR